MRRYHLSTGQAGIRRSAYTRWLLAGAFAAKDSTSFAKFLEQARAPFTKEEATTKTVKRASRSPKPKKATAKKAAAKKTAAKKATAKKATPARKATAKKVATKKVASLAHNPFAQKMEVMKLGFQAIRRREMAGKKLPAWRRRFGK